MTWDSGGYLVLVKVKQQGTWQSERASNMPDASIRHITPTTYHYSLGCISGVRLFFKASLA